MSALTGVLNGMGQALLSEHDLILSPKEFIPSFIRADHLPLLTQVHDMVGAVNSGSHSIKLRAYDGTLHSLNGTFAASTPPTLIPDYVSQGLLEDAPHEVSQKFQDWLDERVRIGNMMGDAHDAIDWLNEECGNAAAFAVMFPAITTLLSKCQGHVEGEDSSEQKRARKIANSRSFGALPTLTREVKARLAAASDLVLNAAMLPQPKPINIPAKHVWYRHAYVAEGRPHMFRPSEWATFR